MAGTVNAPETDEASDADLADHESRTLFALPAVVGSFGESDLAEAPAPDTLRGASTTRWLHSSGRRWRVDLGAPTPDEVAEATRVIDSGLGATEVSGHSVFSAPVALVVCDGAVVGTVEPVIDGRPLDGGAPVTAQRSLARAWLFLAAMDALRDARMLVRVPAASNVVVDDITEPAARVAIELPLRRGYAEGDVGNREVELVEATFALALKLATGGRDPAATVNEVGLVAPDAATLLLRWFAREGPQHWEAVREAHELLGDVLAEIAPVMPQAPTVHPPAVAVTPMIDAFEPLRQSNARQAATIAAMSKMLDELAASARTAETMRSVTANTLSVVAAARDEARTERDDACSRLAKLEASFASQTQAVAAAVADRASRRDMTGGLGTVAVAGLWYFVGGQYAALVAVVLVLVGSINPKG